MSFSSIVHVIHFSVWETLYLIFEVTELCDIVIRVPAVESMLRSENVSSSPLEQSHRGTVRFDSYYSYLLDKQR